MCVGYATTFRMFMQMMDIECMVEHNTEKYHSWDLVKIDGDWYQIDATWDDSNDNWYGFDQMLCGDRNRAGIMNSSRLQIL